MSTVPRKIFIQVDSSEQQENIKNTRKTLKVLQKEATDKENLVGRSVLSEKIPFKKSKSETAVVSHTNKPEIRRRKSCLSQDSTTEKHLTKITEEDLTTEGEPSDGYWKTLAEKRRIALDISLKENEELHEKVAQLEEELTIKVEMLEASKSLVEVLSSMIEEDSDSAGEATSDSDVQSNTVGKCSHSTSDDERSITDSAPNSQEEMNQVPKETTPELYSQSAEYSENINN